MADYNPFPTVDLTGPATARQNIDGASPDAFGAGVGRQMVGLGQQIGQIGAAFDPGFGRRSRRRASRPKRFSRSGRIRLRLRAGKIRLTSLVTASGSPTEC